MAGRVDLRVPPRLIETARAAQYANRETLGARELERKIKGRAQRQVAAVKRADPIRNGLEGGQLEFSRPEIYPIRTRRRLASEVDVGLGIKRIFWRYAFTYKPPTNVQTVLGYPPDFTWQYESRICYGTMDGNQWSPVIDLRDNLTDQTTTTPGGGITLETTTHNEKEMEEIVLPLGDQSMLIILVTTSRTYTVLRDISPQQGGQGPVELSYTSSSNTYQFRAFQVTTGSIQEVNIGSPAFLLDRLPKGVPLRNQYLRQKNLSDYYLSALFGLGWVQYRNTAPFIRDKFGYSPFRDYVDVYQDTFASSNCYEGLTTFAGQLIHDPVWRPVDWLAKTLEPLFLSRYRQVTNKQYPDLLNVQLNYDYPDDYYGSYLRTYANLLNVPEGEVGTYGSFATEDVFRLQPVSIPLPLNDEVRQVVRNNASAPIPHRPLVYTYDPVSGDESVEETGDGVMIAYDMHGGTYCRDQLAALGITLS